MSKIKSSVLKNVLSTLAFTGMLLGVMVTPAMATQGDYYDSTTMTRYSAAALTTTAKSALNTAYSSGHKIIKEQAASKYLDYNGAYDLFSSLMLDGVSLEDALSAVVTNTTLHPTINPSDYHKPGETLSVASVNIINVTTTSGTAPVLPSTVTAIMSDGTTKAVNVTWVTPIASQYVNAGTFNVNGSIAGSTVTAIANITVNPTVLSLPGATLQYGVVEIPYTASISAKGGTPPYNYVASNLPAGLTMGTDGAISGTPTASGTTSFTVNVTDSATPTARTASQSFNITVIYDLPCYKPVIYLYPTTEQQTSVQLIFNGKFTCTYPEYKNGWEVIAHPDGTLLNLGDNKEYSYLFWEGILDNNSWDMTKGFVVAGKDTKDFLQDKLSLMGLTPKEYNEFIVYWLPKMQDNQYNLITFANEEYEQKVLLSIDPKPDSVFRVFMVYKPIASKIDIPPQQLMTFDRAGFSIVEWGGTEVR